MIWTRRSATRLLALSLVALAALGSAGCATKPGVIFPPLANAPAWPPPPDEARIRYVGELQTSIDLQPGVSGLDALGQAIFGKGDTHTMLSPVAVCTEGTDAPHAPGEETGRVFVADSNAQLVHVFDLHTRKYASWQPPRGQPPFSQPVGIAWDPARQRLLVSDSVDATIVLFDHDGKYLGRFGQDILQRPVGVAVDTHDRILVLDTKLHQLLIFSPEGNLLSRVGKRGNGPGQFNFPTNLTLDRQGRVYVSDSLNFRIQQFDAELQFVRQIGRKGDLPGYFSQPKGVTTDSEGHLYVIDANFENIQLFDPDGQVLMDFGEEGHGRGQFWLPVGLWMDGLDRLWVADSYNRRIQVFDYRKAPPAPAETQP